MKIGVMLRHFDQPSGGVKVYTRAILPLLFSMGASHKFVLMYQRKSLVGTYAAHENVQEESLHVPGSVTWDQLAVPYLAKKHSVDVIFNPKFTIPLLARGRKIFVLHGSEWFEIPQYFRWYDRLYHKIMVPIYCKQADAFIAVSHAVRRDALRHVSVDPDKVKTIHNGFFSDVFQRVKDQSRLTAVRQKYGLPSRFILWAGQIEARKNVARLLEAFSLIKDEVPHYLVLAGENRWSTSKELRVIDKLGIGDRLVFPGWISHEDLPSLYTMADLFALPSIYEGFGIPLIEAMACGCPVVSSNTCAPPEVLADAGILVDPVDVLAISDSIKSALLDCQVRARMIERGLARARDFSWEKCAKQVLDVIEGDSSNVDLYG